MKRIFLLFILLVSFAFSAVINNTGQALNIHHFYVILP